VGNKKEGRNKLSVLRKELKEREREREREKEKDYHLESTICDLACAFTE